MIVMRNDSEEQKIIDDLRREIRQNVNNMRVAKLSRFLENEIVTSEEQYKKLKTNQFHYIFKSASTCDNVLSKFFTEYAINRLAKESYKYDIGEKFRESYVSDRRLGYALKNGKLVPAHELVIEFCALPFWEGVRFIGMPYKVTNIYLVA